MINRLFSWGANFYYFYGSPTYTNREIVHSRINDHTAMRLLLASVVCLTALSVSPQNQQPDYPCPKTYQLQADVKTAVH